ncbi:MAG: TIM barrel protein [SAR202 cluster bacterium]|nr:TIM barrel protein [SAR202 cluster bacterium]
MIKVGVYATVNDTDGQFSSPMEFTEFAGSIGLDYIDHHPAKGFTSSDPGYLRHLRLLATRNGLAMGPLSAGGSYTGTPEQVRKKIDESKQGVDMAVLLGAPLLRLTAGPPSPSDPDQQRAWDGIVKGFQEVADYAATKAISLGLCNHGPGMPKGDDMVRLFKEINRPNITAIMDTGRWWPNKSTGAEGFGKNEHAYGFMEQVAPYTSHVMTKIWKIDSGREEYVDYDRVCAILKKVNFNGGFSICYKKVYSDLSYRQGIKMAADHIRDCAARAGL